MSKSTKGLRKAGIASVAVTLTLGAGVIGAGAANAVEDFSFDRINGDDRYHTSALVAHDFGDYTEAILANGEPGNYADALAASYLAGVKKAPVLLTKKDTTPETVIAELEDQGVKNLTVVGGETVISAAQVDALEADGYTVTRVAGDDRFATNREIIEDGGEADVKTALVATGFNYADALAGGPAAYKGSPLALTGTDDIDDETVDALKAAGVTDVVILGGTTAVEPAVENELKEDFDVERVAGDGRSETSTAFADYAKENLGFVDNAVNIATGFTESYGADALSGAPLTGQQNRPLLITRDVNNVDHLETWLTANANTLEEGIIFGGNAAVSVAAQNDMEKAAQSTTPPASNQDFAVTGEGSDVREVSTAAGTTANTGSRQYTVAVPAGTDVNIALFDAADVVVDADGNATFKDAAPIAAAAANDPGTSIEIVNGAVIGSAGTTNVTQVNDVQPVGGNVTFTVDSTVAADVVPVVYSDTVQDDANALNFATAPTATSPQAPSEDFGVGNVTHWVPGEAGLGTANGLTVTTLSRDADYFVAGDDTYYFDGNDTYRYDGVGISQADFERIAGEGAVLDTAYNPNEAGVSIFDVQTAAIDPASAVKAVASDLDSDGSADDVTVTWTASDASGVVYDVYRDGAANGTGTNGTFDSATDTRVAANVDGTSATALNQPDGDFRYFVVAKDPATGATSAEAASNEVRVPREADTTGPATVLEGARVNVDTGFDNVLDAGDSFVLTFDEAVNVADNAAFIVTDGTDTATITRGQNATFTLNTAAVAGVPAGQELTVTITGPVTENVSGDSIAYDGANTEIANRSGITDSAGNAMRLVSDLILDENGSEFMTGGNTSVVVNATTIRLVFNEPLVAGSVAADGSDFTVAGAGAATAAAVAADGRTVTLTGAGFVGGTTTVAVSGTITDTDGQDTVQGATGIPAAQ